MSSHHNRNKLRIFFPLVWIFTVLCFVSCGRRESQAVPKNVILIIVDALRADHLSCYGYPINTTPVIDALAKKAAVCTRAYSQANYTPTSMASILTGTYPFVHKVYRSIKHGKNRYTVVPESLELVSEALLKKGYYTAAVSSTGWVSPDSNFGQGFADFYFMKQDDDAILAKAAEVVRKKKASNFFMYIHLLDLHNYFNIKKPYASITSREFRLSEKMREMMKKDRAEIFDWLGTIQVLHEIGADDLAYLVDRYDSALRKTDAAIGKLVGTLGREGLLDETLLVVTGDHGENFFEHQRLVHGGDLIYNEVLNVPLIMSNRKMFPKRKSIDDFVETIDIFPTILEILQIKDVSDRTLQQLQGESVLIKRPNNSILSESQNHTKVKIMFQGWSYIYDWGSGGRELYDLRNDPGEKKNIVEDHIFVARKLHRVLEDKINRSRSLSEKIIPQDVEMNEKVKEGLKSLGYIK